MNGAQGLVRALYLYLLYELGRHQPDAGRPNGRGCAYDQRLVLHIGYRAMMFPFGRQHAK